jgi:hypothetical protein
MVFVILVIGCVPGAVCFKNYELNETMKATVGSQIISKECRLGDKSTTTELLYGGVANDIIKVSYREYSNKIARPAFYQELQYDLKQSKTILYKNTKIQILSATNEALTYRILYSPEATEFQGHKAEWKTIDR